MASTFARALSARRSAGLLAMVGAGSLAAGFLLARDTVSAGERQRRRYPPRYRERAAGAHVRGRRRAGSGTAACDGPGMMGALGSVLALLLPPLLQVLAAAPRGQPGSAAGAAAEARIGECSAGRAGSEASGPGRAFPPNPIITGAACPAGSGLPASGGRGRGRGRRHGS